MLLGFYFKKCFDAFCAVKGVKGGRTIQGPWRPYQRSFKNVQYVVSCKCHASREEEYAYS